MHSKITCQPSVGSVEPSLDADSVLVDPSVFVDETDVDSLTKTDFTVVVAVAVVLVVIVASGGTV